MVSDFGVALKNVEEYRKKEKDKRQGRVTVREGCTGTSREVCVCFRIAELRVFLRKAGNVIFVQRSGVHGESWEGLNGLGWEDEKQEQGKAAEVNSVPWHGPKHDIQSSHYFATSDILIL